MENPNNAPELHMIFKLDGTVEKECKNFEGKQCLLTAFIDQALGAENVELKMKDDSNSLKRKKVTNGLRIKG